MGIFDNFPYTNFHELNLDWILKMLQQIDKTMSEFVAINALKYADPIQWSIIRQYEKNTIVIDPLTGTAYISVQPVPSGVAITNTDYWTVVFDLGAFVVRASKNFAAKYEDATTLTATFPSSVNDWLIWGDVLYKAISPIVAGDQYVVNSNIQHFTMEDVIGHLEDLNTTDKSNIVAAINEVLQKLIDTAGDLDDLSTTDKSNLVAAINEVNQNIDDTIGDLDNLNTTDKSNVVAAINEVNDNVSNLKTKVNNLKIYNVLDYGAVGDGVTDDTAAITSCIAANGGAYFPAGTYLISSTIYLDTNQYLLGEDSGLSIIKAAAGSNIDMIKSVGFDALKGTDDHDNAQHNITIANLTVDGNHREHPEINTSIGTVINTAGSGVSLYAGGINMFNVNIVNCADDGLYTEWASYLNTIIMVTGGESVFENLVIKCNGLHGWEFMGPHDSIISDCVVGTNNRKNAGCHNIYTHKGNFKMSNCHLYSDYGQPKVASSMYIDSGAAPIMVVNSDIEGGGTNDLSLGNSRNLFASCRFYASFGSCDIYIANATAKNNIFEGCYAGNQVTETGLTPPTWNGAIEFGAAQVADSIFDFFIEDTPICIYAASPLHCMWRINGYNTTKAIDGRYDALPNPKLYPAWEEESVQIRGTFDTESFYDYLVNAYVPNNQSFYVTAENAFSYYSSGSWVIPNGFTHFDYNDGIYKYYNAGTWTIPNGHAGYNYGDGLIEYYDSGNWVIPTGTVRYYSGALQYWTGSAWTNV